MDRMDQNYHAMVPILQSLPARKKSFPMLKVNSFFTVLVWWATALVLGVLMKPKVG